MTHEIKLLEKFCEAVETRHKTFEVRLNDRNYSVGDFVIFIPWDTKTNKKSNNFTKLSQTVYEIKYILSGWGIQDGYITFSIEPLF